MAKFFALALLSVCFTVFAAVSADEEKPCIFKEMFKDSIDACKDKISDENFNLLKENKEASNEEIDCYRACIAKHAGLLKDGKFEMESVNAKIDEKVSDATKAQLFKTTLENCAKTAEGDEDDCKKAASFSACAMKAKAAMQE